MDYSAVSLLYLIFLLYQTFTGKTYEKPNQPLQNLPIFPVIIFGKTTLPFLKRIKQKKKFRTKWNFPKNKENLTRRKSKYYRTKTQQTEENVAENVTKEPTTEELLAEEKTVTFVFTQSSKTIKKNLKKKWSLLSMPIQK